MELLITIFIGVFVSLVAAEIIANVPRISKWLIYRATLQLPEDARDRFSEEWLAHLDELPGSLGKLRHAAACRYKASFTRSALTGPNIETVEIFVKYFVRFWMFPRMLPSIVPQVVRGDFRAIQITFALMDHFVQLLVEWKLKRKMSDPQVHLESQRWLKHIKRFTDDPAYRDAFIGNLRKQTAAAQNCPSKSDFDGQE